MYKNTQTGNKEYDGLKATSVSLVGGNSDGKKLFLEIEVFDGEHTNRYEVDFPVEATSKEVTDYMIDIIEENPKLPPEIVQLMQRKVFWDATEQGWYSQFANEKPARIDDQDDRAKKYEKAKEDKEAQTAKDNKEHERLAHKK